MNGPTWQDAALCVRSYTWHFTTWQDAPIRMRGYTWSLLRVCILGTPPSIVNYV